MSPVPLSYTVPESAPLSSRGMESVSDKAKKAASWNPIVTVHLVEPVKRKDGYDLWWTGEDISRIKQDCRITVKYMDDREYFSENDNFCARGLESRTEQGSNMRKMRRIQCAFGVLDEQEFQREKSIRDASMISELYVNLSGTASQEAYIQALQDQKVALEYATSTSERSSMMFKTIDIISVSARSISEASKQNTVAGQAA
jgi:hypothetical protein